VDKPEGPTSHDVVARARRLFHTRAVGHTGTLDPFATGLLVLVFGAATRLARWAGRHRKTYTAAIRLGVTTETDDRAGAVLEERVPGEWPSLDEVRRCLTQLTGRYQQRPPAYSAKRLGGVRSHRLARRGSDLTPGPVAVEVLSLELVGYQPPVVTICAEVGPGTYIRSLGRDLGELLATGAHVTSLRRDRVGPWDLSQAHPFETLTGAETLLPPRALVIELPGVELAPEEIKAVGHGRDVVRPGPTAGEAALLDGERLIAVGRAVASGWHPAVVLFSGEDPAP